MKEITMLFESKTKEVERLTELLAKEDAFCIITAKDMEGKTVFQQSDEIVKYYKGEREDFPSETSELKPKINLE